MLSLVARFQGKEHHTCRSSTIPLQRPRDYRSLSGF